MEWSNHMRRIWNHKTCGGFGLNSNFHAPVINKVRLPLCSMTFSHSNDISCLGLGSALMSPNRTVLLYIMIGKSPLLCLLCL